MTSIDQIGVVIIGRNEGDRLVRCLTSAKPQASYLVYVDSGSTDGSQTTAEMMGADVVVLDLDRPFTAARARNSGLQRLKECSSDLSYVQFIDGDCELRPDWIAQAAAFLDDHMDTAVVCGRRRERFPEASVYNALIDQEWDTETGETRACGGDALMRIDALDKVGGFNPELIAGEEPELCVRLRALGWKIWRLDAEMTLHDAALNSLSQWWRRNQRAGHAYAEGAALHGAAPEFHGVRETRSALFWGAALPVVAVFGTLIVSPMALLLFLAWPLQVIRLGLRDRDWRRAFFLVLGKFPEAQGAMKYWWNRFLGERAGLIEYK